MPALGRRESLVESVFATFRRQQNLMPVVVGGAIDVYFRIEFLQPLVECRHREDAARNIGRTALDMNISALEQLRIGGIHALGYAAMLVGTLNGEFAQTTFRLFRHTLYGRIYLLAEIGEHTLFRCLFEKFVRNLVVACRGVPARAVATEMAYVNRSEALRSGSGFALLETVGMVDSARAIGIIGEKLRRQRLRRQCRCEREGEQN